jgi:mannose-6-phosphate isomerase-like protein (cupin superfamily)
MLRHKKEMTEEKRPNMRGGDGEVTLSAVFSKGDYDSATRLFSRITLPVGASIGYHIHENEEEFFYFLSGKAEFNDNGTVVDVHAGDATVTRSGQGHAVRNNGDVPLELMAVIALVDTAN